MSSEVESDDGFDPSPLPAKRRRLNPTISESNATGDSDSGSNGLATSAKKSVKQRAEVKHKNQKPKHFIRVHRNDDEVEDKICSQLPDIPSSPWRIRGARWQKAQPSAALVDKSPNTSLSTAKYNADLPHTAADVTRSKSAAADQHYGSKNRVDTMQDRAISSRLDNPFREAEICVTQRSATEPPTCDYDFAKELANLPSDAFASSSSSPSKSPVKSPGQNKSNAIFLSSQPSRPSQKRPNMAAPQRGLQQMTLFGQAAQHGEGPGQGNKVHNWPLATRDEPPTHHALNEDALKTYVYPTNLGNIRDYQFSIVKRGLYHNLLVALPTGLGKTFIAATIMLNWFRWTENAQIIFVAPTKPLVSQQVEACFHIAGIPRSETSMMIGGVKPEVRAEEYLKKRVFFMTPQTVMNDLKSGICNPKRLVLLVVDEAHRATGAYAYVEVVKFIRQYNESFRVLALTATPGNSVETVQEVIDGLDISRVEIRTEISIDIRQYVHARNTEQVVFDNTEEMEFVMDLFSKALHPVLSQLRHYAQYWSADPMQLTAYGLTKARQSWLASSAGKSAEYKVKGMVNRMFTVLSSLAHSIELLKFHGIGPFFHCITAFQSNIDSAKGSKYENDIAESEPFRRMMTTVRFWVSKPEFIGHPKLDYLQSIVLKHFSDAGETHGRAGGEPPSSTRIMIFAHFRDSAEEIVRVLKRNQPMIRPHVFIGQAASKGFEGMDQKRQLEVIQQFKSGVFNTLVATSIGEEGLDIGEIDLIICYDSSASPIRMLQRMGRTGRKRAGNIILLLMRGKEENQFVAAKDNYEKMQQMIADAKRFNFHDQRSRRIVPRHIEPLVDKRVVEIPPENMDSNFLPEPKRRTRATKKPPKKFHMPEGVRTGFIRASRMDGRDSASSEEDNVTRPINRTRQSARDILEAIPSLSEVLLTKEQHIELSKYQDIPDADDTELVIGMPSLTAQICSQSKPGPTKSMKHGHITQSAVSAFKAMREMNAHRIDKFKRISQTLDMDSLCKSNRLVDPAILSNVQDRRRAPQTRQLNKVKNPRKVGHKSTTKDDYGAQEALSSSPPATDPQLRLQSQGIDLGSDTSGDDEVEGEPSSDLRDFVVNDGEEDDDAGVEDETALTSSLCEIDRSLQPPRSKTSHPFYISQKSTQGESEDEELPDLQTMLRSKATLPDGQGIKGGGRNDGRSRGAIGSKWRVIDDTSDPDTS